MAWQSWWDAAWQPTPRWLSALGADREAQSFDWPTAAQQSWRQSPSAAADATVPLNNDAPLQDHRTPSPRPTARLKTLLLSHPGPSCHVAASVPRSAPKPRTRDWTLRLAPHLSMQTGGARPLLCAHHALRVLLASHSLPHWKCNMTTRCRSTSFPQPPRPRPSPHASHKRRMPVPPKREHQMCLSLTAYRSKMPVPSKRENTPPSIMLVAPFPKPAPIVLRMSRLCGAQAQLAGHPRRLCQRSHASPASLLCAPVEPRTSA